MCLVVVVVINLLGAGERFYLFFSLPHQILIFPPSPTQGAYGECEFVFASIKVVTITGLIVRLANPYVENDRYSLPLDPRNRA